MSWWGAFSGSDGKKQAGATLAYKREQGQAGYDANKGYAQGGYASATGRYDPYAAAGRQGQEAYTNLLGLNGADARRNALAMYQGSNPYLAGDMDAATQAVARRAAAQGQGGYNGLASLAQDRATREMGSQDYNNYLARLQGLGQQGVGVAGAQAGLDMQNAGNLIGIENAYRNGNMNAQSEYANMYNQANTAGMQNWLGLAGTLGGAALSLGTGGMSGLASRGLSAVTGGYDAGSMSGLGGALASRNYGNVGQSFVGEGGMPRLGGLNYFGR